MAQTVDDRVYILANLPIGTRRIQVLDGTGRHFYKRPDEIDVNVDEIALALDGTPVVMRGSPGRPGRTTISSPLGAATPQIAAISEAREYHIDHSPLLKGARKNPEGDDTFNAILRGMAEEAGSIEFDRMEAQRQGQETSHLASKRARVLKSMADLLIRHKQGAENRSIDLESPAYNALFSFTMETFKGAMAAAGCRGEVIETVFTHLSKELSKDWKEEARTRMKGK